jgi:hypothetical protein
LRGLWRQLEVVDIDEGTLRHFSVEADAQTHATVPDLVSGVHVSWRKILSFSILA